MMLLCLLLCSWVLDDGASDAPGDLMASESPSRYCGLHCVHAAGKLLGRDVPFEDLVNEEFLNGEHGSSGADIQKAAAKFGLSSKYYSFMTLDQLRLIQQPTVLHVRTPGSRDYTHWVLFLGAEGSRIKLYDPPRDCDSIPIAEFLSRWDGVGIVLSQPHAALPPQFPIGLSFLCAILSGAALITFLSKKVGPWSTLVIGTAIMVFVANTCRSTGFFWSSQAIEGLRTSFFEYEIPELTLHEFNEKIQQQNCQLVDARIAVDYRSFHIDNAVSIPIDSGILSLMRRIDALDKHEPVIVYCQSERCLWARKIAQQIAARSFKQVYVYRGGVNEWRLANK